jgi:type II secretory ATPase GspE/PulE/Tfp pilus assembly ATPase PilB-like protein
MPITDEIRALVLARRSVEEIHAAAVAQGMRTMREDGVDKVKQGLTTLAEIARVSHSL